MTLSMPLSLAMTVCCVAFPEHPDMIETSSNLAIVQSGEGAIDVTFLARSSSESMKAYLVSMIESTFLLAGARVETSDGYPGWQSDLNSPFLNVAKKFIAMRLVSIRR